MNKLKTIIKILLIAIMPGLLWAKTNFSTPNPPELKSEAFILMDAKTGYVLAEKNARKRQEPASLAKLMTLLVIYDQINEGYLNQRDKVQVSKNAWQINGSKMFLKERQEVSVADLIRGIIVVSANDACIAIAEHLAGSTQAFTQWMNEKAKQLNLHDTHFSDPIGFSHSDTYSTAYDMALLSRYLLKHYAEYYHVFKEKWFTFNEIKQPNRNRLLWQLPYVDGIKTGHTQNAGYTLVASGKQANMRLISVTMQAPSENARTTDHKQLLAYGFKFFSNKNFYHERQVMHQAPLWYGTRSTLPVGSNESIDVVCSMRQCNQLTTTLEINKPLKAPIKQGTQVGLFQVFLHEQLVYQQPVVALETVSQCSTTKKVLHAIQLKLHEWFYA